MFLILLMLVLIAAAAQLLFAGARTLERAGMLLLVWLLVGYCGVPMLVVATVNLARPGLAPELLGFPAGNPFQTFLGWAYLGMAVAATMGLLYRDRYLLGPAVIWAIFFSGATAIHLHEAGSSAGLTHGGGIFIFATHGLISVLLATGVLMSGLLRRSVRGRAAPTR